MCDENTCNLCAWERNESNLLTIRNGERFLRVLRLQHPMENWDRLRAERRRLIESGELVEMPVLTCQRCGRAFKEWIRVSLASRFCPACHRERWDLDEDGVRTRAHELGRQSRERARLRQEARERGEQ